MLEEVVNSTALFFELVGGLLITFGGLSAIIKTFRKEVLKSGELGYYAVRRDFAHRIVFGLDFLIAGDILKTLVAPGRDEIILLGAIVSIRTVLGYFLTKEAMELKREEGV